MSNAQRKNQSAPVLQSIKMLNCPGSRRVQGAKDVTNATKVKSQPETAPIESEPTTCKVRAKAEENLLTSRTLEYNCC